MDAEINKVELSKKKVGPRSLSAVLAFMVIS